PSIYEGAQLPCGEELHQLGDGLPSPHPSGPFRIGSAHGGCQVLVGIHGPWPHLHFLRCAPLLAHLRLRGWVRPSSSAGSAVMATSYCCPLSFTFSQFSRRAISAVSGYCLKCAVTTLGCFILALSGSGRSATASQRRPGCDAIASSMICSLRIR